MLKTYLPALIFILLGLITGGAFVFLNRVLGPSRPSKVKADPYECGLPSDVQQNFRFGISFYLVAMLFILFDIETVFMIPWGAVFFSEGGGGPGMGFLLVEMLVFIFILLVGYIYVWKRKGFEWN
jgi:NADH-quinone oxidoreductase subunit A